MVEGEMKEVTEDDMIEALNLAHDAIKVQCQLQIELTEAVGKTVKRTYSHEENDEHCARNSGSLCMIKSTHAARLLNASKKVRSDAFSNILDEYLEALPEDTTVNKDLAKRYYHDIQKKASRDLLLNEGLRFDGRKTTEIRAIWSEVDYLTFASWICYLYPWRNTVANNCYAGHQA